MKVLSILFLVLFSATTPTDAVIWNTDMATASTQAKEESKVILLSFSGSDWCGNCIRLEKTLFDSPEFAEFASENLVLLNADFPMRKANKLSAEQTTKNEALAEKYNKKGVFPTVLILDAEGTVLGRLTNPKETSEEYLKELKTLVN